MAKFWCRFVEESAEEAIAVDADDAEDAAIVFARNWDIGCGDHPILHHEYPDGFQVIVTEAIDDQNQEDRWQKFSVHGDLVPHYSAEAV